MIRSNRIHEEQIRKVAQNLNAPFYVRTGRPGSFGPSEAVRSGTRHRDPRPASGNQDQGGTGITPGGTPVPEKPDLTSGPAVHPLTCIRCGSRIPALDFLYTQETGMCIPCWEEQEALYGI